jgi:predicted nucleic acid-binding protein
MAGIVLTDASPLIGLARVNGLGWLQSLFGTVWMPTEVRAEVLSGLGTADEAAIAAAVQSSALAVCAPTPAGPALPDLDEGEAACIRLALAHPGPRLLLMDERAGRAVAIENGLRVAGTAAVIGMARQRGLIPNAKQVFTRLHASDFRISAAVIQTVLRRVGEP